MKAGGYRDYNEITIMGKMRMMSSIFMDVMLCAHLLT